MDEMTSGEMSRSLARLEKSQGEQTTKLDEIKDQNAGEIHSLRKRVHDISNIAQNLVMRDATMAVQVNNLVALVTDHKSESKAFMGDARETLGTIKEQVTRTNGRVDGHDDQIRDIKDTLAKREAHSSLPVTTADGESISIKVSNKMWASLCGLSALLSPLVFEWLKKVFGGP